jgi:hypothetical protein
LDWASFPHPLTALVIQLIFWLLLVAVAAVFRPAAVAAVAVICVL